MCILFSQQFTMCACSFATDYTWITHYAMIRRVNQVTDPHSAVYFTNHLDGVHPTLFPVYRQMHRGGRGKVSRSFVLTSGGIVKLHNSAVVPSHSAYVHIHSGRANARNVSYPFFSRRSIHPDQPLVGNQAVSPHTPSL